MPERLLLLQVLQVLLQVLQVLQVQCSELLLLLPALSRDCLLDSCCCKCSAVQWTALHGLPAAALLWLPRRRPMPLVASLHVCDSVLCTWFALLLLSRSTAICRVC